LINIETLIVFFGGLSWAMRSLLALAADIWGNVYLFTRFKER
jgi:hypothetical protein